MRTRGKSIADAIWGKIAEKSDTSMKRSEDLKSECLNLIWNQASCADECRARLDYNNLMHCMYTVHAESNLLLRSHFSFGQNQEFGFWHGRNSEHGQMLIMS